MTHQLPQHKNYTVGKVYQLREDMIKEANAYITSTKNKIDTQKKINHKHSQKKLLPSKIIIMTQLTKQINQGLFQ